MDRKKRILFVDDEPMILNGLRRALRSERAEWETFAAAGGREALDILSHNDIDVVVSDMRMPGMMGSELLAEVRKRHPGTIRLALSGQASNVDADRCVGPVHQSLSKPCGTETLKEALSRARVLIEMPVSDRLKNIIGKLEALPALPEAYDTLLQELQAPKASIQAVAAAVSQDIAMSSRILQLVSSSFYSTPTGMASPARQAELLGLDVLRRLAGSPQAFCRCSRPEGENFSLARECNHARTVASFAKRIAETENAGQDAAEEAYWAGLLHDVGKVVFITEFPDEYDEALSLAKEQAMAPLEAEYRVLQATHPAAGAYLLGLWGLPDAVVRGAAFHHGPPDAPAAELITAVTVHVADVLGHEFAGASDGVRRPRLNEEYLAKVGLTHRASTWRDVCLQPTAC